MVSGDLTTTTTVNSTLYQFGRLEHIYTAWTLIYLSDGDEISVQSGRKHSVLESPQGLCHNKF